MKICGIYTITNSINNKLYIGLSTDIAGRLTQHKYELKASTHINKHLQKAWNKYGEQSFLFEILVECEEEYLFSEEHYWCTILNTHNRLYGYNERPTHPLANCRHSEETKEKIKEARKKQVSTIESRLNQSRAATGKYWSVERKEKMSKNKKGRKHPKWLGYIVQLDNNFEEIRRWEAISDAAKECNIASTNIWKAATHLPENNKKRKCSGFYWKYDKNEKI